MTKKLIEEIADINLQCFRSQTNLGYITSATRIFEPAEPGILIYRLEPNKFIGYSLAFNWDETPWFVAVVDGNDHYDPILFAESLEECVDHILGENPNDQHSDLAVNDSPIETDASEIERLKNRCRELRQQTKPAHSGKPPSPGDAFLVQLENGDFSVCRVLQDRSSGRHPNPKGKGVLVASTTWFGRTAPSLSDPKLLETLSLTHSKWNGTPVRGWVSSPPPINFQFFGVVEPLLAETQLNEYAQVDWDFFREHPFLQYKTGQVIASPVPSAKPPCPKCGKILPTAKAAQCPACRAIIC